MLDLYKEHRHAAVREGFQILLRADAELWLPTGMEKTEEYYRRTADACMKWAEEAEGERLRADYLWLEDNRERSRFRAYTYRLECRPVWQTETHAAWVCDSSLHGKDGECFTRRSAQVWDLREQMLLPFGQILRLCKWKDRKKRPPFRPDGVYPEREELVFFRNSDRAGEIMEFRVPYGERESAPATEAP